MKIVKLFTGFSVIGAVNTLIHFLIVVGCVEFFSVHPVISNILAFIVANTFSFWANSRWNFKTSMSYGRYGKFLMVSILGLVVTVLMSSLAEWLKLHYLFGVLFIFIAMPLLTFTMHYRWTWSEK